ncbi:MAG: hypothetical protein M3R38_01320 [Actinomycetota bacterium]|nr:hypothetical protein [Actinomycetota bacterium]
MISLFRMTALNLPRLTAAAGVILILAVGLVHLWEAPAHFDAARYVGALFVANSVASLVSAVGIALGAKTWGWSLGALVSGLSLVLYLWSRAIGLPGLAEAVGDWDEPLGSLAMVVEILFLVGYATVMTGIAVATPERRHWHD